MAKDALYDAEDMLDELATETLRCKLEAESKAGPNQVWNWNPLSTPCSIPSSRGIESKLKKVIEKLELIAKYKDVLGLKDIVGRLFGLFLDNNLLTTQKMSALYVS